MKNVRIKMPENDDEMKVRCFVTEDILVDPLKGVIAARHSVEIMERLDVDDADGFHFDQGGIMMKDEPELAVTMDGAKFSVFLRHTDGLVYALSKTRRSKKKAGELLGEHVIVHGAYWSILFTPPTAKRLADLFQKEIEARAADIEKAWDTYRDRIANMNKDELRVLPRKREKQEVEVH